MSINSKTLLEILLKRAIATLLYATQEYVGGSGSALAKYTVKKNSTCLSANTTTDQNNSSDYAKCMSELEMLVKTLINNSEVNLQDCEVDANNATLAYCQVVVWYRPNIVIVTDSDSVSAITANKSNSTISTAERRKRNTNNEDIFAQNLLENVKNTDLKMQQKLLSLPATNYQLNMVGESKLEQQTEPNIRPTRPTEINPIAEPPVSEDDLEEFVGDEQFDDLVRFLANKIKENITETEQNIESPLQKPDIDLGYGKSIDEIKD